MRFGTRFLSGRLLVPMGLGLLAALLLCGALFSAPHTSMAYDPPPHWSDVEWQPISCDGVGDPLGEPGIGKDAFDLVCESADAISAYYYWDADFLYLRERVDGRPSKTAHGKGSDEFGQYAWVVLITLPGEMPDYFQYLVNVNGMDDSVEIWENTVIEAPIYEWRDEADTLLWSEPTGAVGGGYTDGLARYMVAASSCGGNDDYFVDWAIPVSALIATGVIDEPGDLNAFTDESFFFATSADQNNYNKDYLDCRIPQAQLLVNKAVDPALIPENVTTALTYTIGVTNISDFGARMVQVIDDSPFPSWIVCNPPSVTFGDPAHSGVYTNTVNSAWDPIDVLVDPLVSGDTVTITLGCQATPPSGEATAPEVTFTNTSCASASNAPDLVCDPADLTVEEAPATLTLEKVLITDDGGDAQVSDFQAKIDGSNVPWGVPQTLSAGTYTVSETGPAGYAASDWTAPCTGGTVTLASGDDVTCSITNDDIAPTLTLEKVLINDNGGGAQVSDFQAKIDGSNVPWGVPQTLSAGTYTVSETGPAGYAASDWTAPCTGGTVTLGPGDEVTCSITNDDMAPTLTLVKTVINDDGGNLQVGDFPLFIDGNPATSGVAYEVLPDVEHTASETQQNGYTASVWGGDCNEDGTITLLPGENATCTISNDDQPAYLIVIKDVVSDEGGTASADDFTMTINGVTVVGAASFPGAEDPGTTKQVYPGTYDVTETGPGAYSATFSADCSGSIALGETKTCTVTNDDTPICVEIEKTGDSCAHPGEEITYHFWVHNCGEVELEDVTVTDPLWDPDLQYVVGTLAPDDGAAGGADEASFDRSYTVPSVFSGDLMPNTATVEATDALGTAVDDQDGHVVQILHPCIKVTKKHVASKRADGEFFWGDRVTYVIKVTNCSADTPLNNVTVVDNWEFPYSGTRKSWSIGYLGPGDNRRFSYVYTTSEADGDDIINKVTARGEDNCAGTVTDRKFDQLPLGQEPPEEVFVPEWNSVLLLASGLAPLAGYARMRLRKR